jgi:hypothetical protein
METALDIRMVLAKVVIQHLRAVREILAVVVVTAVAVVQDMPMILVVSLTVVAAELMAQIGVLKFLWEAVEVKVYMGRNPEVVEPLSCMDHQK